MNFEDKVLALFDNGRRSAAYVAGYQSARAQAAAIAAEADRLIAEMAVENAELRERLSSLESLYRARDKDCAAKDAALERVRKDAERIEWLEEQTKKSYTGISFDYHRHVEDGYVVDHGYRFMRRHFASGFKDSLRKAIDAAMEKENKE